MMRSIPFRAAAVWAVALLAGCGGDPYADSSAQPSADATPAAETAQAPPAEPAKPPMRQVKHKGGILGKTTSDIVEAPQETKPGGPRVVENKIQAGAIYTLGGNVYTQVVGKTAQQKVDYAVRLFHGLEGRYPKDFEEFKTRIIKANSIRLPRLPIHQWYAYDSSKNKLLVMECGACRQRDVAMIAGDVKYDCTVCNRSITLER